MLYIVLALVLSAFGLLIAALTTANTLWAWMSVVVSVVAAALLVSDWLNGRRKARAGESARPTVVTVGGNRRDRADEQDREPDDRAAAEQEAWFDTPGPPASAVTGTVEPETDAEKTSHIEPVVTREPASAPYAESFGETFAEAEPAAPDVSADDREGGPEPAEEPTDASDLLVVAGLSVEVRVVDEHPRYHLANCTWVGRRATIPIPVSEARQLGFTPCARCGPDAVLAARHRAAR